MRMARAVVAGLPHHVTRRGNRRERVFFCEGDAAFLSELEQRLGRKFLPQERWPNPQKAS